MTRAAELGQKALGFSEHGNIYLWTAKKAACEKAGLKYLHGVECYLTERLTHYDPKTGAETKVRDNFHTVLIARDMEGLRELNSLVSLATRPDHFYYSPRLSFDEFFGISEHIIKISACLASPLNKLPVTHPLYNTLVKSYDYLEIQPHDCREQMIYNRHLASLSEKFRIPLIAGTDTHSIDPYKAECRALLKLDKGIDYANEDDFDLTYKSFDELKEMFRRQDALPEALWTEAIANTNRMADSCEPLTLDTSFKYPVLYGDRDAEVLEATTRKGLADKLASGEIPASQEKAFNDAITEELRVFGKLQMPGFMQFMSELVNWCRANDIPVGPGRGSVGGSRVAYLTGITDINPETWHTVFSRFANEDRMEIGDIDIDVAPVDQAKVHRHIIDRFGEEYTAFIVSFGRCKDKKCIEEICRGLENRWTKENAHDEKRFRKVLAALREETTRFTADSPGTDCADWYISEDGTVHIPIADNGKNRADAVRSATAALRRFASENEETKKRNPYTGLAAVVKSEYEADPAAAREKYAAVFRYFDGFSDVIIQQSTHPAGIVASPVTLADNYGVFWEDDKPILQIDMDCVHDVGLVKYDILGLVNVAIIRDTYAALGKPYPRMHEINWDDSAVWKDMLRSPVGIFQFESDYAMKMLRKYEPKSIFDVTLVTAALRPSGASYRDELMEHIPHHNPSPMIDELLADNNGYLVYQEDVIKFLQQICGFSGSAADNTRRAIARKDEARLEAALPLILDGYCAKSPLPRAEAEAEAREFLQIIEDASSYMFNYNHSVEYSHITYLCAYLRCYHAPEYIAAYLQNAEKSEDIENGTALASEYGVRVVPPSFGISTGVYSYDKAENVISKGIGSIKYLNEKVGRELHEICVPEKPATFMEALKKMRDLTSIDARQRNILTRLDFFSCYGNARELLKMTEFFVFLKDGEAKSVSKEKLSGEMEALVSRHANGKTKSGAEAKSWTITDMDGLLDEYADIVKRIGVEDFNLKDKLLDEKEFLGYLSYRSGRPEDRRRLYVSEVIPLRGKKNGEIWAYALGTYSLGTGKTSRLTLRAAQYRRLPVKPDEIIYAEDVAKEKSGYWYLYRYRKCRPA